MRRIRLSAAIAIALALGSFGVAAKPAAAHGSRAVPGLIIGAVIGGILAHEIYRHQRKRYYSRNYYSHYGYAPSYAYSRPYRHRSYYRQW